MKVSEKLKTNLGELYYLLEELQKLIDSEDNQKAVSTKRQIVRIIDEMSEPLDWASEAKERLRTFVIDYMQERADVGAQDTLGHSNDWRKARDLCRVDIENQKIYIRPKKGELDLSRMKSNLPKNTVIEGNLILGNKTRKIPMDLMVEGKLRADADGFELPEWMVVELRRMNKSGQFRDGITTS